MSTEFKLTVKMDQETHDDRKNNGLNLVLMKAVKAASRVTLDARPLAWICLNPDQFGLSTTIKWTETYSAYTSKDQIISGADINVQNSYPIQLGQHLEVKEPSGVGTIKAGKAGSILISNPLSAKPEDPQLTCGIMQSRWDIGKKAFVESQLCAFPLLPNSADLITPISKIFVYFASDIKNTGAVIELCLSQGIMVDFTGATEREIRFDRLTGFDSYPVWSEIVPPGTVVDKLIQPSATLSLMKTNFENERRKEALNEAKEKGLTSYGLII